MNNLIVKNDYNNQNSFQCKKIVDKENISMRMTLISNKWHLNLQS